MALLGDPRLSAAFIKINGRPLLSRCTPGLSRFSLSVFLFFSLVYRVPFAVLILIYRGYPKVHNDERQSISELMRNEMRMFLLFLKAIPTVAFTVANYRLMSFAPTLLPLPPLLLIPKHRKKYSKTLSFLVPRSPRIFAR